MTLHDAIEKLLIEKGKPMSTADIAFELNKKSWYQKKDGSEITAYQIHGRIKNYPLKFNRQGSIVSLRHLEDKRQFKNRDSITKNSTAKIRTISDEKYVLDLCDKILDMKSTRQYRFDFLVGDPNDKGVSAKLPVDAFYEQLNLVIEYREKQHTERINFFDKPNRLTVSGVHRGMQRKRYDELRRNVLPKNGIKLIEIEYSDFECNKKGKILRNEMLDIQIVKKLLNQ